MSFGRRGAAAGAVVAFGLMAFGLWAQAPILAFYAEATRTSLVTLRKGPPGQGIWGVWTGHSFAYGIEFEPRRVALIDSGSDPQASAIIAQLAARGMEPGDVDTILLTHGHDAVTAGLGQFAHATIYVGEQDRMLARRDVLPKAPIAWLQAKSMRTRRLPKLAMQTMWPGQDIMLGRTQAHLVALPGHTWGSFAIVAEDIAFVGGSISGAQPNIAIFGRGLSVSPKHNAWSLARLSQTRFSSMATTDAGVRPWAAARLVQWLQTQSAWPLPGAHQKGDAHRDAHANE